MSLMLHPSGTTYRVDFNSNGGSDVASQTVEAGGTATEPTDPTKEGYEFVAWYSDEQLQNEFSFSTAINANTTLYAGWIEQTNQNGT